MGFLSPEDHPALICTGAPFLLGVSYVASLYVWRSQLDRDHPDTIKRRFVSAAFMTIISPVFVMMFGVPLLLTMLLFLGPTAMLLLDERFRVFCVPMFWEQ